jgi:hypothetical protein
MAWINRHSEIRATADLIGSITGRIKPILVPRAGLRHEITARRKPHYPDLMWINMPLRGVISH